MSEATITSFLVKVASRCNLDCDYCYVYHHADQGWRKLPKILSDAHQDAFATRLADYVRTASLRRVAVIFHGGEPLLAGHDLIVKFSRQLRLAVGPTVQLDVGLQTNGILLSDIVLDALEAENIAVSLSMDGPREAHDLHRTTRRGRSSFGQVAAALERLKLRPAIFAGVIAVIDASVQPETLLEFFASHRVPKLDFLLPDAHHERRPPGRDADHRLYERWLVKAFDAWLDRYPELPIRTFEALLDAVTGLPSGTDAFGFGDVSLVTMETDGTWHDLDVLKVAGDGATKLVGSVDDTSIAEVAASKGLQAHRELLTMGGLSSICHGCEVVEICGGGSVPHRFKNGRFDNPTVYCEEMQGLIRHVADRLHQSLEETSSAEDNVPNFDIGEFELAETSQAIVAGLELAASADDYQGLKDVIKAVGWDTKAIDDHTLKVSARRAGTIAWQRAHRALAAGRKVCDVDGRALNADDAYFAYAINASDQDGRLEIAMEDHWLRKPFGTSIIFEDEATAAAGRKLVSQALAIIEDWRPALALELGAICSAIQFVRDPTAHPDKIVSFSDDSVPGALFVSIVQGDGLIDAYDLADSLIHEYRHQKLYLFERLHPTTKAGALVVSPWREDMRPVSGLIHAVFVFVELSRFWEHVRDQGPPRLHNRAIAQLEDTERNLAQAFETLGPCDLTKAGQSLVDVLRSRKRQLLRAA